MSAGRIFANVSLRFLLGRALPKINLEFQGKEGILPVYRNICVPKMQPLTRERVKDLIPFLSFSLALLLVILIADLIWIFHLHAKFDTFSLWMDFLTTSALLGACAFLWRFPVTSRLGRASVYVAVLFAFPFPLLLLNEVILTERAPMIDATLANWDAALGLNWVAWRAIFVNHSHLNLILNLVYNSITPQVITLIISLGAMSRFREIERLTITLIVGGLVTALFGGFAPTLGPYVYYGFSDPTGVAALVQGIYDGQGMVVDLSAFKGTVSFPSYHTAMSIAFVIAAWPIRWLRFPFLALNAVLLIAIPLNGGHYFVDMIGGAAMTVTIDLLLRIMMARKRPLQAQTVFSTQ